MGQVLSATDATFTEAVLASAVPVLVDFWAAWCGPCRMMAPVLAELAAENADRIKVVKVDADANIQTLKKYGVQALPTLMLFVGGHPVKRSVGYTRKGQLQALIEAGIHAHR